MRVGWSSWGRPPTSRPITRSARRMRRAGRPPRRPSTPSRCRAELPRWFADAPLDIDGAVADSTAIYFNGFGDGIVRVAVADGARTDLALPAGLSVDAIAVNGGAVYVAAQDLASTSPTNGLIMKMPATGGPAQTLITNIGHPWSLVADASGLFWVEDPPVGSFGDGHLGLGGARRKRDAETPWGYVCPRAGRQRRRSVFRMVRHREGSRRRRGGDHTGA